MRAHKMSGMGKQVARGRGIGGDAMHRLGPDYAPSRSIPRAPKRYKRKRYI